MELNKIYDDLCVYDKRNPAWQDMFGSDDSDAPEPRHPNCACDNCFYGRDKLAIEIIRLKGILEKEQLLKAIAMAYQELNTIRARDGVPFQQDGCPSNVDEEYFSHVVDELDAAMIELTGKSAHCHPALYK